MNDDLTAAAADEGAAAVPPFQRPRRKGIYVLPNAITLAALFASFYSIVMAMNGRFDVAAIGIFCAAVLDSLDGRVARMTHSQSAFGEQMDSLCDMVGFGAAPALIVYEWALKGLGKMGWIPAFVYIAGAALRLARFNTNIGIVDKRYFQGLPSPAAAALVAGFIWVVDDFKIEAVGTMRWIACIITLFAGLTMVSNVPFYSFKDIKFRRSVPFWAPLLVVFAVLLISTHPPTVLFLLFVAYSLSGYLVWAWNWRRKK